MRNTNPKQTTCHFCHSDREPLELSQTLRAYIHRDCVQTNVGYMMLREGKLSGLHKELADEFFPAYSRVTRANQTKPWADEGC